MVSYIQFPLWEKFIEAIIEETDSSDYEEEAKVNIEKNINTYEANYDKKSTTKECYIGQQVLL